MLKTVENIIIIINVENSFENSWNYLLWLLSMLKTIFKTAEKYLWLLSMLKKNFKTAENIYYDYYQCWKLFLKQLKIFIMIIINV